MKLFFLILDAPTRKTKCGTLVGHCVSQVVQIQIPASAQQFNAPGLTDVDARLAFCAFQRVVHAFRLINATILAVKRVLKMNSTV